MSNSNLIQPQTLKDLRGIVEVVACVENIDENYVLTLFPTESKTICFDILISHTLLAFIPPAPLMPALITPVAKFGCKLCPVKLKMAKIEIPPIFTLSMKTNSKSTSSLCYLPKS